MATESVVNLVILRETHCPGCILSIPWSVVWGGGRGGRHQHVVGFYRDTYTDADAHVRTIPASSTTATAGVMALAVVSPTMLAPASASGTRKSNETRPAMVQMPAKAGAARSARVKASLVAGLLNSSMAALNCAASAGSFVTQ